MKLDGSSDTRSPGTSAGNVKRHFTKDMFRKRKYGVGLCAYLLYQIIEMQIPQNAVAKSVRQLFGLPLSPGLVNHVKAAEAGQYQATYRAILDRICIGKLVHADETKVGTNGKDGDTRGCSRIWRKWHSSTARHARQA